MPLFEVAVLGLSPDLSKASPENLALRFPLVQGIRAQARRLDVGLKFMDPRLWKGPWMDFLGSCRAVVVAMNPQGMPPVAIPYLRRMGAVWLLPTGDSQGLTRVLTDEGAAMEGMVGHLADTGRRRLAFVGFSALGYTRVRAEACRSAVEKRKSLGLSMVFDADWTSMPHAESVKGATHRAFLEAMEKRVLRLLEKHRDLEALVCATDLVAKHVYRVLLSRGLDVPGDMALTGFDDIEMEVPPWGFNPFTTVRQDLPGLASSALYLAVMAAQGTRVEHEVKLPGRLILRHSTATGGALVVNRVSVNPDFAETATRLLEEHGFDDDPVGILAGHFQLGREYFLRKYQKVLGRAFYGDLTGLRLRHGAHLLRHTDLPVRDVLTECGWKSHQVFGRAFKQVYRMGPREYREKSHASVGKGATAAGKRRR